MGSCAAPSAKGDDKFITTDYLQQCRQVEHRPLSAYEELL
nr:DNA replication protein [Escherichia coli]